MTKLRRQPKLCVRPDREVYGLIPCPYRRSRSDTACTMLHV